MNACCGKGGRPAGRPVRRISGTASAVLPGAALLALPKCPLCLAAWLTLATGASVSAASAAWLRGGMVALCVAGMGLAAARLVKRGARRGFGLRTANAGGAALYTRRDGSQARP
ncbi:MAG TPA: hypothetical protein VMU19_10045 [Bryobacteraceae bacterium]|nr:hypothetical protein [Bryobacteraceae bacterium]